MSTVLAWIKASRLSSQSYIFLPILTGQLFALANGYNFNWNIFILLQSYGLFMQLYIVYANDFADQKTDVLNKTYNIFSGGSRVLIDGSISPRSLATAAWIMVIACVITGLILSFIFNRSLAPLIIIIGILLLWMYSYKPVKLSYRGGGEFLQMIGVGLVLPLIGFYGQANTIINFPFESLLVIFPTQLACAIATSIPDYASDVQSNKKTATVHLGKVNARIIIILLNAVSLGILYFSKWIQCENASWFIWIFVSILLFLTTQIKKTEQKQAVFLFVFFSIFLTLGIMSILSVKALC